MNPEVDTYFEIGCGRCALGGTPDCKVHKWQEEMARLRRILLDCGLTEEVKWSVPCYTFQDGNILLMSAFVDYCALSFFKGALLKDDKGILEAPGENTQAARLIRFTGVAQIAELETAIRAYVGEAIELEKAGLQVDFKAKNELQFPPELEEKFARDPDFYDAFQALTPGRQRGYLLYFTGAKQSQTRNARIEKYRAKILEGKGFHD